MGENAAALVASSVLTAALGLVFWVIAARLLPTADVGTGSAVVASIVLLGNFSTLGLRNGLVRFMAAAGDRAARFVATSYALCATVAVVVAIAFAAGTPLWADELEFLRTRPAVGLAFALAVATWTVFVLQDNVLTGLRRAVWIPAENLAYSALKLTMLAALVGTGAWALPVAWCVPALLMIVPVNALVFRRLLPRHEAASGDSAIFTRSAITRFSVADHAADVIRMLGVEMVALVVLALRGAEDTAYVFFAITIAATGQLVASNIVTAFVAEASSRPEESVALARRAGRSIGRLVVPGALLGALAAPVVLAVFGEDYADNGTTLLRLLILDSIPLGLVALATGWARMRRDTLAMVSIAVGVAAAPLAGVLLAPSASIEAIGWTALLGHSALAVAVAATTLRPLWAGHADAGVAAWLLERRSAVRRHRRRRMIAAVLDELDASRADLPPLEPRRLVPTDNDTAVVRVDHPEAPFIVKVALSARAADGLDRHASALAELRAAARHGDAVVALLPRVLDRGRSGGHDYVVETACAGRIPMAADHRTLAEVAGAVVDVHALTAGARTVDDVVLHDLVDAPLTVVRSDRRLVGRRSQIDVLGSSLRSALVDRRLVLARTHGDCWLGNALIETSGADVVATGLIDWEDSSPQGLPDADLAHLWLAADGQHIGRSTVAALADRRHERMFVELEVSRPNPGLHPDVTLLLAWLAHVAGGLRRASRFGLGSVWLSHNVEPVLDIAGGLDAAAWIGGAGESTATPRRRSMVDAT